LIPYPHISPVIVRLGPIEIRWYGLMYLLGFAASFLLFNYQVRHKDKNPRLKDLNIDRQTAENLYFWLIAGLIIGARLGYVVFYNLGYYLHEPLKILYVWQGGMSFHGGLIGAVVAGSYFCHSMGLDVWLMADLFIPTVPPGIGFGRLGNFINGELFGRPAGREIPWAMVFPEGGPVPRHPSQLYEFLLEGVVLFVVLWSLRNRVKTKGMILALFFILYGVFRFSVEFVRQPDPQLGFVLGPFTMGQILSAAMVVAGAAIAVYRLSRKKM
jgi:phosphatidylglycerol:prolipoprotein diacylglycerol transferase